MLSPDRIRLAAQRLQSDLTRADRRIHVTLRPEIALGLLRFFGLDHLTNVPDRKRRFDAQVEQLLNDLGAAFLRGRTEMEQAAQQAYEQQQAKRTIEEHQTNETEAVS